MELFSNLANILLFRQLLAGIARPMGRRKFMSLIGYSTFSRWPLSGRHADSFFLDESPLNRVGPLGPAYPSWPFLEVTDPLRGAGLLFISSMIPH